MRTVNRSIRESRWEESSRIHIFASLENLAGDLPPRRRRAPRRGAARLSLLIISRVPRVNLIAAERRIKTSPYLSHRTDPSASIKANAKFVNYGNSHYLSLRATIVSPRSTGGHDYRARREESYPAGDTDLCFLFFFSFSPSRDYRAGIGRMIKH